MCRYPFGSGGNRVTTFVWRLAARSAAMISRMKSRPVSVSATAVSVMLHHPLKAAADRGYGPGTLYPGRHRRAPRRAHLARARLGWRNCLPIPALRAPPPGCAKPAKRGPCLSLLLLAGGTRADAREGAQRGARQAL